MSFKLTALPVVVVIAVIYVYLLSILTTPQRSAHKGDSSLLEANSASSQ